MAGYKETPRQKMIGMMYLVLTALLALNVSKDILEAFVVVNASLEVTNQNLDKKNESSYTEFENQYTLNKNKVQAWWDLAKSAKENTKTLVDTINAMKAQLIAKVEGITLEEAYKLPLGKVNAKDNYDIPTQFFIGQSATGEGGRANKLKNMINDFKKKMTLLLPVGNDTTPALRGNVIKERTLDDGTVIKDTLGLYTGDEVNEIEGKTNWEMKNFYRLIVAGVITNLNRMITQIKNAEFDVINNLYKGISLADFKFDKIVAKVVPKSSYVLVGDEYEADIFIAAYDSKLTPTVTVWEGMDSITTVPTTAGTDVPGSNGINKYKVPASGTGEKKFAGIIKIKKPNSDEFLSYNFNSEYVVGTPTATVSADKMNVFYIGVANPVSISVPGVGSDQIQATISTGGTLTSKGAGSYEVWVTTGTKTVTISVSATLGGKSTSMGSKDFRVKKVPDPAPTIANSTGGTVQKSVLAASGGIIPVMKDFDFELYFTITSFTMTMNVKGDLIEKYSTSNKLTAEMTKLISGGVKGTKIYFEDIKAVGPDKTTRTLAPINIKLL
ncbi:MAG: gliding motility protein GldM [Bacteroidota bacterium]